MKFIVLHGDDTEKSYKRLAAFIKEAKKRGWDIVNDKIEETSSLFEIEKLIIVRNINIIDKITLKIIEKIPGTLVIYSERKLPVAFLKTLPKDTKKELFELPFLLWKFLDNMNIKNFQEVTKTQPVEMTFAMMARRFRDFYRVENGNPPFKPWQISKLKSQYLRIKTQNLKLLVSKMAQIDIKSKTGGPDLKTLLDIFIVKRLS